MATKLIVVTGATGNQGQAVIDALIKHGGYSIRGLTRDVEGSAAQELASKGVKMVPGHLLDRDSLIKAFAGAYAVFGVSVPFISGGEVLQGQNLVDACKADGVALLVWSSLPSASVLSNGKYNVSNFDQKAEVDQYIKAVAQPAVILHTGTFAENVLNYGYLNKDPSKADTWHLYTPIVAGDVRWPLTYIGADLGPTVLGIIENWENPVLKSELSKEAVILITGTLSGNEMAETIQRVTGKACDYVTLPAEMAPAPVIPAFKAANEGFFTYGDKFNPDILRKLGIKTHTFEDYVKDCIVPFMTK